MHKIMVSACTLAALLLPVEAESDVLSLSNGNQLDGTLEAVTILVGGEELTQARAGIASVSVSETGKDFVELRTGEKLKGEFVSLKFRSVDGLLTLERKEVRLVTLSADLLDKAREELAAKKTKVPPGDAEGLLKLARWCRRKGLKAEAVSLARASLKADHDGKCSKEAHKLLGHVFCQGKWMTLAEFLDLRLKTEEQKDETAERHRRMEKLKKDLTHEQLDAITAALLTNIQLYKTYLARAEEQKKQELEQVKGRYRALWTKVDGKVKGLLRDLEALEKNRNKIKQNKRTSRNPFAWTQGGAPRGQASEEQKEKLEEPLREAKRNRQRIASAIKSAQATGSRRASRRRTRISLAYQRNKHILLAGKPLTTQQMIENLEAAIKEQ